MGLRFAISSKSQMKLVVPGLYFENHWARLSQKLLSDLWLSSPKPLNL